MQLIWLHHYPHPATSQRAVHNSDATTGGLGRLECMNASTQEGHEGETTSISDTPDMTSKSNYMHDTMNARTQESRERALWGSQHRSLET